MRFAKALTKLGLLTAPLLSQSQSFIRLGVPFGDHMVLQHDSPIILWGTGCPGGDTVKVSIAGQSAWTHSDWQGRWELSLPPMKPGGPYQLLIEVGGVGPLVPSPAANARGGAELNDVMIGEVVLASSLDNETKEARSADISSQHPYAFVRVFSTGADGAQPNWSFVSQDSLSARSSHLFSRGANLAARLRMPVGIIEASNGPVCTDPSGCSVRGTSQAAGGVVPRDN